MHEIGSKPMSAEKDLASLEEQRCAAMIAADCPVLSELFADDLVWTHSSARVDTKANFLKALAAGTTRYLEIKRSDEKFRVHGNFAVITGLVEMHAVVNGSEKQLRNRYTSIWCRRNGAWKMIMWQSTAVGTPH
jgi:ketosteroid isomerase-like protein